MQGLPGNTTTMNLRSIHLPKFPECWESCGSCAAGNVFILELLVAPGDRVERDDTILTLETGKVALDIPSPWAGKIVSVHVIEGDTVDEGALLATLEAV
jgi:biotin carboxyl carrier protein